MLNKTTTYTAKEALDADPNWTIPVKLGKGRMPKGGKEHVEMLVAQGYRIKGYHVETKPVSTSTPGSPAEPKVVKVAAAAQEVKEFTIFWPEESYKAVAKDKKVWGMREVCNTCRVSLVQCQCGNPTILGGVSVSIVPK